MDLKKFLPGQDKSSQEYYWALVIEPGWVQSGIWRIEANNAQIIFSGEPVPWNDESDLVTAADAVLSSAIKDFPEDIDEPSKTVFGVVSSWVAGGQIKEEYLEIIKNICGELSLKPVGFVVLSEAIAHYYKAEEGSPLNAVILGTYKDTIEVSVFKLGNLLGNTTVAKSVSMADDVVEGLSRFAGNETIPSRFILYDGRDTELEDDRQLLTDVNWEEMGHLKFLHTPKVEIVDAKKKIFAVSLAGASEMGEITNVQSAEKKDTLQKDEKPDFEMKESEEEEEEPAVPEAYGFSVDSDPISQKDEEPDLTPEEDMEEMNNVEPVEDLPATPPVLKRNTAQKLQSVKQKFSKLSFKFHLFPRVRTGVAKPLLIGLISFILLFAGGLFAWWYLPKAAVTIYIAPRKLEQKVNLTVDPKLTASDIQTRSLPGELLPSSVQGDKTISTTGTKLVGDKAKGEITIYRVGTSLTLPAKTVVLGPGNLRFTLDESVVLASGSAGSAGTIKTSVTAEDIGTQYNLASGTSFKVGNYSTSDMEAKNESAFTGGTSNEIRVVSDTDQKQLLSDLQKELEDQAASDLQKQLSDNKIFIKDSLTTSDMVKVYSGKVGDEASSIKLTLTMKANAFAVDKNELIAVAREALKDQIPNGYILRDDQINVDFTYKGKKDNVYSFETIVSANLLPQIDETVVAERISGKYTDIAREYLRKEVPGFSKALIRIKPQLPGRLGTLPRIAKNIVVEISADE